LGNETLNRIEEKAKAVLLNNRRRARSGGAHHGFTCPSPHLYHWQWLWDSCFHAIALRWFDPDFARKEILSLLSGQWEDGRVPNMVHVGHNWRFDRIVHGTGRDTSGITQPPIIADAVMRIHEVSPDTAFLEKVYTPLKRYKEWLHRHRETDGDGLIAVYHPWETGIDNSPRWDEIFDIRKFSRKAFDITKGLVMFRFNFARYDNDRMRRVSPFFVKGIDMNCYYYASLRAMAAMARELGRDGDAEMFESRAENTKGTVRSRMWDEVNGRFVDLVGRSLEKSYVPTPFSFLPAWGGIADERQAACIHAEITDPRKYWSRYPVPTTSMDWPAFDEDGYWRGTVWINTNWFTIEALAAHGYRETACEIKEKTLEMVDKSGFREYYNPHTGKGLGAESFAWSTLVIDLINRDFKE